MNKYYYIFTDLDSTFEGDQDAFTKFEITVSELEKEVGDVKLCFVTGTSFDDVALRLIQLGNTNPGILKRFDFAVTSDGFYSSGAKTLKPFNNYETVAYLRKDKATYSLIKNIGKRNISGITYMGDSIEDVKAMELLRDYKPEFEYGTYNIMPNSSNQVITHFTDYVSPERRIDGCIDGLNYVISRIKIKNNEKDKS